MTVRVSVVYVWKKMPAQHEVGVIFYLRKHLNTSTISVSPKKFAVSFLLVVSY